MAILLRCFGLATLVAAAGLAARGPQALEVAIVAPEPGVPAIGPIEVRAEVYPPSTPLASVDIYLDGIRVGELGGPDGQGPKPPYRLTIDAGEENTEHILEVVAHAADGRAASSQLRTPAFHSDLEMTVGLQQLYVNVEDRDGRVATGIEPSQFVIFDDGAPQRLVTFARGDIPFAAVVLLDSSLSMAGGRLQTALAGVRTFAASMRRLDEAKLVLFADRVRAESPFTAVPSLLTLTLAGLSADGGTALNDALFLGLSRLEQRQGRRVAIVLSDGVDIESVLSIREVERLAGRSGVVVYWVRLDDRVIEERLVSRQSVWRGAAEHREEIEGLARVVRSTGGRVVHAAGPAAVGPALAAVLTELREQYVIGYYPSTKKGQGSAHRVEVEIPGGYRIRTRTSYIEP